MTKISVTQTIVVFLFTEISLYLLLIYLLEKIFKWGLT